MLDRFILKLKVNGLRNPGIYGNLLLYELLTHHDQKIELVQGYLTVGKETCWHVWVEQIDDGAILDVIRESVDSEEGVNFEYTKDIPEQYESDDEITKQYELYKDDKKEFWKKTPQKIKNFRAKMFRTKFL